MPTILFSFSALFSFIRAALAVTADILKFVHLLLRPKAAIAAENLFLRNQLGLYVRS